MANYDFDILSNLNAAEHALRHNQIDHAIAIIGNIRRRLAADVETQSQAQSQPPLRDRLLTELDAIEAALSGVDGLARVCARALRAEIDDEDDFDDIANTMESVSGKVRTAQGHLTNVINLMPEVTHRG